MQRSSRRVAAAVLASLLSTGCVSNVLEGSMGRGKFPVMAITEASELYEPVSPEYVAGEACFDVIVSPQVYGDDNAVRRAFERALSHAPTATALVDVTLEDKGSCVTVRGRPVRPR